MQYLCRVCGESDVSLLSSAGEDRGESCHLCEECLNLLGFGFADVDVSPATQNYYDAWKVYTEECE